MKNVKKNIGWDFRIERTKNLLIIYLDDIRVASIVYFKRKKTWFIRKSRNIYTDFKGQVQKLWQRVLLFYRHLDVEPIIQKISWKFANHPTSQKQIFTPPFHGGVFR